MTTIKLKNGSGAPLAGDLVQGEPALDLTNKRLYTENSGGTVIEVGTNPTSVTTGTVTTTGNVGIGGASTFTSGTNIEVMDANVARLGFTNTSTNGSQWAWFAGTSGQAALFDYDNSRQAMTIDASGNVLVGKTSTAFGTAGVEASVGNGLWSTRSSLPPLALNRLSTDGSIADFYKDGAPVGSIGINSLRLTIGNGNTGLLIAGDLDNITPFNTSTNASRDAAVDLGNSGVRFKDLHLSGTANVGGITSGGNISMSGAGIGSRYVILGNETNTYAGSLVMQAGGGSAAYGGSIIAYGHSHASKAGDIVAGISSGSGGSFRVNTSGIDGGADVLVVEASGNVGIGNSSPLGRLTISNAAGTNAPTTVTAANTYLQLGSDDYGPSNNGKFMIGFGFTDATNTNSPAYIGYEEVSTSGDTYGDLTFYTRSVTTDTAPTERMRIASNGAVLVGKTSGTAGNTIETNGRISAAAGSDSQPTFNCEGDTNTGINLPESDRIQFITGGTERMRIDASGNLLVGTTTQYTSSAHIVTNTATATYGICIRDTGQTTGAINFENSSGTQVGNIILSSTTTTYNTSSDQRLKENIVDAPSASDDIDAIQVRSFDWKADGSHQKYGMVAQELQTVAPEAVSGDADSDDMMGVDYSKLVPMLVKEIQSLRARVAQLEGAN